MRGARAAVSSGRGSLMTCSTWSGTWPAVTPARGSRWLPSLTGPGPAPGVHLEGLGRAPVAVVGFAQVDGADGVPAGLFLPLLASAFTVVVVDQVLDLPELLVVAFVVVEDVDFQNR